MSDPSLLLAVAIVVVLAIAGAGIAALLPRLVADREERQRRLASEAIDQHERLRAAVAALCGNEYLAASEVAAWRAAHGDALALARDDRFARQLPEAEAAEARAWCRQLRDLDATVSEHNDQFVAECR